MLTSLHSRCFMRPRGILVAFASLFLLTSSVFVVAQKKNDTKEDAKKQQEAKKKEDSKEKAKSRQLEDASKALKKWIDEDVSYIITNEERTTWKGLKTDEERESFIESYW